MQTSKYRNFGLSPYIPVGDKNYALKMLDLAHVANHARVRIWAPFNGNGSTYQERYYQFRKFIDELLMRAEELNVQLARNPPKNNLFESFTRRASSRTLSS
ncbi:hypothetical protein AB3515_09520 [Acinetobacter baumannii]